MTDILTRLAALTRTDTSMLAPCTSCGAECDTLSAHGFGNYSVRCFGCGLQTQQQQGNAAAIAAWNTRPREAALIVLVQEAAGEIERLHSEIVNYRTALNRIAHPLQYGNKELTLAEAEDVARRELVIGRKTLETTS
jgi:hypothetical protein